MAADDDFYGRGFDHLETIATTLQNLRGESTLAYELIQNADDAVGASELTFRFTPDCLEVIDNGGFEACDDLKAKTCPWEQKGARRKGKKRCDFHGFRKLAGASKRDAAELTGAFGVGFLSVYQITDQPELLSAGRHWIIDDAESDEQKRIRGCPGCTTPHIRTGTCFRLPWAAVPSQMRELLDADPIPPAQQAVFFERFCEVVPRAMLFLHHLKTITIEHYDRPPVNFRREPVEGGVHITGAGRDERWFVLEASFADKVADLRREHPRMRERNDRVQIAVLPGGSVKGLVHATLPTQFLTGLPLHVNASFFPRFDRKGILLDDAPTGEWNRAAIDRAAELLAEQLEPLVHRLGSRPFWGLIRAAHDSRDQTRRGLGDSFGVFWEAIKPALPDAVVMETGRGDWSAVRDVIMPGREDPEGWADLLEDLSIRTVADSVQPIIGEFRRAVPCAELTLDRLLAGLERSGLAGGPFTRAQLPAGLGDRARRDPVRRRLARMVPPEPTPALRDRLRALALWRTTKDHYASLADSWLVDPDTVEVFGPIFSHQLILGGSQDERCATLINLGDPWRTSNCVDLLCEDDSDALPTDAAQADRVLGWLGARLDELDAGQLKRIRALSLIPTTRGLHPALISVIPGGFADPFEATEEITAEVIARHRPLLDALDVGVLSFGDFVKTFVPGALKVAASPTSLLALLDAVALEHRRVFDEDPGVRKILESEAWVLCSDAYRRKPDQVYFDTEIVRSVLGAAVPMVDARIPIEGARADLLRAVGVKEEPRPADIIAHVQRVAGTEVTDAAVAEILRVLQYLAGQLPELGSPPLATLRSLPWLPAERITGGRIWGAPGEILLTRERWLFEHAGTFVALSRSQQDELGPVLAALGVRRQPPVELVIQNVLRLVARGDAVEDRITHWLNADGHWRDPGVSSLLTMVAWLRDTGGVPQRPSGLFRDEHPLSAYLPVLAEGTAAGSQAGSGANGATGGGGSSGGGGGAGRRGAGRGGRGAGAGGSGGNHGKNGSGSNGHGGAPKPPGQPQKPGREAHEWWSVFVSGTTISEGGRGEQGQREARRRNEIDEAGMATVKRYEIAAGRVPDVPEVGNNPGFDLWSYASTGELERYIEVKSLAGEWGPDGFPMPSPEQWEMALRERDRWWLYVVEFAESDHPIITRIQNPPARATKYILDPGWRALGEPDGVGAADDPTEESVGGRP